MFWSGYVIEPDSGGGTTASGSACASTSTAESTLVTPSAEELRNKRLAFLERHESKGESKNQTGASSSAVEKPEAPPTQKSTSSNEESGKTNQGSEDLAASGSGDKTKTENLGSV